jgi:signal transduction histidine kinase
MARRIPHGAVYTALAAGAAVLSMLIAYTGLASQLNDNIYDFIFRSIPTHRGDSGAALLVFDERSLHDYGGTRSMRGALALALHRLAEAKPRAVAIDILLADAQDAREDAALAAALAETRNLVLACEMPRTGAEWQDPLESFRAHAVALGHDHTMAGPSDNINRRVALEKVVGRQRRWALSLEAFRVSRGIGDIESSPTDLMAGKTLIISRWDQGRPMRVRYRAAEGLTTVAIGDVIEGKQLDRLKDRVVFIGVTAQSGVYDRLPTPLSPNTPSPGVEVHAQAFETMAAQDFLDDAPPLWPVLTALLVAMASAALFTFLPGWPAYSGGVVLLLMAHAAPFLLFAKGLVLPPFGPVASAWFSVLACASFQFFYVRRQLRVSEATTARYQQAFHFVAHEMRTPLTAIQGSSELITRYKLSEPKRQELGMMINSESKRLAKMITTFLDVEKLGAGQMELRVTEFALQELVDTCYQRAMPLAERKQIRITSEVADELLVHGDRELLEYALYNLITNAIKYSAAETDVVIRAGTAAGHTSISVQDHGMGMDAAEVKNLFRKFYRTRRAEQSGETGTGIGLSIVHEIVTHHGGRMAVESAPGKGSTFTVILPVTLH